MSGLINNNSGADVQRDELYKSKELVRLGEFVNGTLGNLANKVEQIALYRKNGITVKRNGGGKAEFYTYDEAKEIAPDEIAELEKFEQVLIDCLVATGYATGEAEGESEVEADGVATDSKEETEPDTEAKTEPKVEPKKGKPVKDKK